MTFAPLSRLELKNDDDDLKQAMSQAKPSKAKQSRMWKRHERYKK